MKKILRPLPPHLTLFMSQLTSTFPISHRISGAFLATIVLFSPILCPKIGLISLTHQNFYQSSPNSSKFLPILVGLTAFALGYHLFFGVRHLVKYVRNLLFELECRIYILKKTNNLVRKGIFWIHILFFSFLIYRTGSTLLALSKKAIDIHIVAYASPVAGNNLGYSEPSNPFTWSDSYRREEIFSDETTNDATSSSSVNQPEERPCTNPVASPGEGPSNAGPSNAGPEVYKPLMEDWKRHHKLSERLATHHALLSHEVEDRISIINTQVNIEKKIEQALLSDGFGGKSIRENLEKIRGILFYPEGIPLSTPTYSHELEFIKTHGTHHSAPYRRIIDAIHEYELFLLAEKGVKKHSFFNLICIPKK